MSEYDTAWRACQGDARIAKKHHTALPAGALVYSAISHRNKSDHFRPVAFSVYRNKVKIHREKKFFDQPASSGSKRGQIDSFTEKSRRRLREIAINATPELVSMFVCTYASRWPSDGVGIKSHLDAFLKRIKRKFPQVNYLWVLEFQRRGAPHFHVFLTTPKTDELHRFLAESWVDIAGSADDRQKMLNVHTHARSFIDWDMGSGNYVCKYLDKEAQKTVPAEFQSVGRFWGASRGIVPKPSHIIAQEMSLALMAVAPNSVKQATRWLCKWHEKHTNGHSRSRHTAGSYSIPTGAPVLRQIMRYFMKQPIPDRATDSPF